MLLTEWLHTPVPVATAVAGEAAILVNLWWQSAGRGSARSHGARAEQYAALHLANGVTSLAGTSDHDRLRAPLLYVNPAIAGDCLRCWRRSTTSRPMVFARATWVRSRCISSARQPRRPIRSDTLAAGIDIDGGARAAGTKRCAARRARPAAPSRFRRDDHEWRLDRRFAHHSRRVDDADQSEDRRRRRRTCSSRARSRPARATIRVLKLSRLIVTVTYDTDHDVRFTSGRDTSLQPQRRHAYRGSRRRDHGFCEANSSGGIGRSHSVVVGAVR